MSRNCHNDKIVLHANQIDITAFVSKPTHLGLGRIRSVHAKYVDGEVIQKVEGVTGIVTTVAGRQARRNVEIEKIVEAIQGALQASEESQESVESGGEEDEVQDEEERRKDDERREQWETLG